MKLVVFYIPKTVCSSLAVRVRHGEWSLRVVRHAAGVLGDIYVCCSRCREENADALFALTVIGVRVYKLRIGSCEDKAAWLRPVEGEEHLLSD